MSEINKEAATPEVTKEVSEAEKNKNEANEFFKSELSFHSRSFLHNVFIEQ